MNTEDLDISHLIESRLVEVRRSLRALDSVEMESIAAELFPSPEHPWFQAFEAIARDRANAPFYHALAGGGARVLYCPARDVGIWFIPHVGKGPLGERELKLMREAVQTIRSGSPASGID